MNEGQLSSQVNESASQGLSDLRLSSLNTEVLTQTSVASSMQMSSVSVDILSQLAADSDIQTSSLVVEVMQRVPRMRTQLLTTFN